jgi:hypothetical protein
MVMQGEHGAARAAVLGAVLGAPCMVMQGALGAASGVAPGVAPGAPCMVMQGALGAALGGAFAVAPGAGPGTPFVPSIETEPAASTKDSTAFPASAGDKKVIVIVMGCSMGHMLARPAAAPKRTVRLL